MRIVNISNLKGNEKLGIQIYDDLGRVLLNKGVTLSLNYIQRLKEHGILSVYIDDDISKDITIEDSISEKTRQMSKHAVKDMIYKYCREGETNSDGILKSVNSVIDDVISSKDTLVNVAEIRATDDNIYSHSINVCVLSTIIGIHFGFNMLKVKDIAVGAILHDIGKVKIKNDKKIISTIKSADELDKYIEMMHPRVGYDFLGEQNICNAHSRVAVLMHHERNDGSGFPLKLKGNEISDIAKLVSICDTFDNMISGNGKEPPKPVYQVIEYLNGLSNYHFDAQFVSKFTMNIAAFPTGSGVILNTNEKCLVIRQNHSMPLRPVLKVIYNRNGEVVTDPYEIDLLKELTCFIVKDYKF